MIITTADASEAFKEIDATSIETDSYTFKIDESDIRPSTVHEGIELERHEPNFREQTVELETLDEDGRTEAAFDTLRESSETIEAGETPDNSIDFNLIVLDRERDDVYLVDTSRYGYEVVNEYDDGGDPLKLGFTVIFNDRAVKLE